MKKIFAALMLTILCIGLVACSGGTNRKTGQVLNCAWNQEPTSLDITKYAGASDLKVIWNIYEPLVRISKGKIVPAGAKSWSVSEDGFTFSFELVENYWSDGKKVTAQDYVDMLKRMANPDNLFAYASDYYAIKNFEKINSGELAVDEIGAKAISDKELEIMLEYPDSNFLASVELYPEREDVVSKYGSNYGYSADNMVCCGPFVLSEWNHNSNIKLIRNDKYWDNENISLDEVNLKIIPEDTTQYMEFKAGNIDYLSVSDENYVNEFRTNSNMKEENAQSAKTYMFLFNTKDSLMQNIKIRQAFSLSINREEICSSLDNGLTTPAYGLIPPTTMVGEYDYRESVNEPLNGLSTLEPKQLLKEGLDELGVDENALSITLSCPSDSNSQTLAEYYKQMWEKNLGVKIEINTQEFATYKSLIWSDQYQIATTAWGGSLEPKFLLSKWLPDNQCQWDNEGYADTVNKAASCTDSKLRMEGYAEAEKMLIADQAIIAPIKYDGYSIFYYDYVGGTTNYPFDNVGFRNMSVSK